MFFEGETVFHTGRKQKGLFHGYDQLDTDTAHVSFLEDGYYNTLRVSVTLLEKIEPQRVVLKTSKGFIRFIGFIVSGRYAGTIRYTDDIQAAYIYDVSFLDESEERYQSIEKEAGEPVQRIPVQIVPQMDLIG